MPCGTWYHLECLIWPLFEARLFLLSLALPVFTSFLSPFQPYGPPKRPNGSALNMVSRTSFRHFPFARVPTKPQLYRRFPKTTPIVVRPLSRAFRLDLTWAHNLLVWWAWISYLESFSVERLNKITFLSPSSSLFSPSPYFYSSSPIYSQLVVGWLSLHL